MARDNDKGLYLPLRVDLDAWEKSLMAAGADVKKAIREMNAATNDLKFRYKVEIEGAKASGDYLKAIQLRTAQTNQLLEVQTRVVNSLAKAYANLDDKNSQAGRDMEKKLLEQRLILYRMQQNAPGASLGAKLSDSLAAASPEFERLRNIIRSVSGELVAMTGSSKAALFALKGLAGVSIATVGVYQGLKLVTGNMRELADAAANAGEPIYQLREEMGSTYEEAERLHTAVKVDGGDARVLVADLNQLYRAMQRGGEGTNLIAKTMKRYGVELKDASGNMKSHIAMLRELADGFKRAQSVGQGADFLAGINWGNNKYMHLLNDLDYYLNTADESIAKTKREYQELHNLKDAEAATAEAARNLAIAKGQLYAPAQLEILEKERDAYKALTKYYEEATDNSKELVKAQAELATVFVDMRTAKDLAFAEAGNGIVDLLHKYEDFVNYLKDNPWVDYLIPDAFNALPNWVSEIIGKRSKEKMDQAKQMREEAAAERVAQEELSGLFKAVDDSKRADEQADIEASNRKIAQAKKEAELRKKYNDALFEATASDYEKEIKRIQDKKQAFMDEGLSEVEAERLYALQKEQIDKKYYDKRKQEEDNLAKKVEQSYQQQIEAARRANEAAMGEAEQTLRNNLKLVRYMEKVRKQGGDYEAPAVNMLKSCISNKTDSGSRTLLP